MSSVIHEQNVLSPIGESFLAARNSQLDIDELLASPAVGALMDDFEASQSSEHATKQSRPLADVPSSQLNTLLGGVQPSSFNHKNALEGKEEECCEEDKILSSMLDASGLLSYGCDKSSWHRASSACDDGDDIGENEVASRKKQRFMWGPELHRKFEAAVAQLGLDAAKPQTISQLMGVSGKEAPSRQNIKSHLQKYRILMKKRGLTAPPGYPPAPASQQPCATPPANAQDEHQIELSLFADLQVEELFADAAYGRSHSGNRSPYSDGRSGSPRSAASLAETEVLLEALDEDLFRSLEPMKAPAPRSEHDAMSSAASTISVPALSGQLSLSELDFMASKSKKERGSFCIPHLPGRTSAKVTASTSVPLRPACLSLAPRPRL